MNIVLVELDSDGRPFHVAAVNDKGHINYYDFDWCKRDEVLYYHCSGGGGKNLYMEDPKTAHYWLAEGYVIPATDYTPAPLAENAIAPLPKYTGDAPWDKLFSASDESETVGCSVCDDRFPDDDHCEHIWWCDHCGWWSTPDEDCSHR